MYVAVMRRPRVRTAGTAVPAPGVWLRSPTRERFANGILFGVGVMIVALAHGGFLARGAEYGSATDVFTWRGRFGYSIGGVIGFLNWNVAGFGIPLLLAIVAWAAIVWQMLG